MPSAGTLTRRATLFGLASAVGLVAAGCDAPQDAQQAALGAGDPAPSSASPTATATPAPTRIPPQRARINSDYSIPPIQGGLAPVITRVTTKQPVVFLTIDDGVTKRPEDLALLAKYDYPVTLFLTKNFVQEDPGYFAAFQAAGNRIQNHTVSHDTAMSTKPYAYQLGEISGMQDYAVKTFGGRPVFFRPPGGAYSTTMRKAVADAGLRAIIHWEAKANAGRMDYQYGNALRSGDIVLMHFRPEFESDLAAFHAAQVAAGLTVVRLEEFLGV